MTEITNKVSFRRIYDPYEGKDVYIPNLHRTDPKSAHEARRRAYDKVCQMFEKHKDKDNVEFSIIRGVLLDAITPDSL